MVLNVMMRQLSMVYMAAQLIDNDLLPQRTLLPSLHEAEGLFALDARVLRFLFKNILGVIQQCRWNAIDIDVLFAHNPGFLFHGTSNRRKIIL
jgi:hypothetical protein